MLVVENGPKTHNLVVCTLCSCYPWPVLGLPPVWEGRVYSLNRAIRAWRKWNLDTDRHGIELLPPADYLRMSYYERWFTRLLTNLVQFGFVTKEEMESGKPAPGSSRATPALTA